MAIKTSYGATEREMSELFSDYLQGDSSRPALVIGQRLPSSNVRNALEKSMESFGFEPETCTYASIRPITDSGEDNDAALDHQALFLLIEGLDPLYVIAVDSFATNLLSQAYRTQLAEDAPIRVFGRPSAAFSNLEAMLETPDGKQSAWRVLKSLR